MSKREGHPKIPENVPKDKKPKLCDESSTNPQQTENVGPQQRPNSPVAGPSSASSDLHMPQYRGLVPIYPHFDHRHPQEGSSQASSFTDIVGSSTSSINTTSSTTVEFGDSRPTSLEDMDVDSDMTISEASTSTDRRNRNSKRKHQSGQ